MAITFVGSVVKTGNNGLDIVVNMTTELRDEANANVVPADGDLVVVAYGNGAAFDHNMQVITAPAYTEVCDLYSNASSTNDINLGVFYRILQSGDSRSLTVDGAGINANGVSVVVMVFRGVDDTTPMDVAAVTDSGIAFGRPNPPAITPTTPGAWIVVAGAAGAFSGAAFTNSDLSTSTNHWRTGNGDDTQDSMIGLGVKTNWASGAFDPAQWGGGTTGGTDAWIACTMALRPAGGGGGGGSARRRQLISG